MPLIPASLSSLAALATIAPMIAMAPQVKREFNPNRNALTELEAAPIDQSILSSLTDWSHPGTLDAKRMQGKVVVLATIAAGDPQSIMTISSLNRMQRDFEDQGIIVAAISQDAGFDQLQERVASGKITIPIARDANGAFAKAMHNDDNPDLYLIDRAGNLRFADIDKGSLKDAIKMLTRETTESAIANAELQSKGLAPKVEAVTTADFSTGDYKAANWPAFNKDLYANDLQGQTLPVPLGSEEWISEEVSLDNKVVVLDFWATWCGPCRAASPILQKLQIKNPDTLAILAIGGQNDPEANVRRYVAQHKVKYSNLYDENQSVYRPFESRGIPLVVVMSTDGVIRWMGNPHDPAFTSAVDRVLAVDPVIAANN
ncbi:MAG: redoxin domain-containing protein [Phycisphaerales bacterium]|nr:redoxin domain-containing protein [Phycisphaerales bacterium]